MTRDQLQQHPAYLALTQDERAAVDARIQTHHLDAPAIAAGTGGLDSLEASDLRFWLDSTAFRPWAMISVVEAPAQADALFGALLAAAPSLEARAWRVEAIAAARALSRALALTESARIDQGYVRAEQLTSLWRQIEQLGKIDTDWREEVVFGVLRVSGLDALARAIVFAARESSGLRGLLGRLGDRLETHLFDGLQGALTVATGVPEHEGHYRSGVWRNWSASYEVTPEHYRQPATEAELCAVVAGAEKLRVVGGGHTFNDSPLSRHTLVSLDAYDQLKHVDREAGVVLVQAGIRLRDLNHALWELGLGLPVLGSTDAQSVGGLVATDLHGTGRDKGFLSEQVRALRIIDGNGKAHTWHPGDPVFHAALGGLGTCGVVSEVELSVVPRFHLAKTTKMVDRRATEDEIESLLADNDHLSFYYVGGGQDSDSVRAHTWNRTDEPLTPDWEKKKSSAALADFALSATLPGLAQTIASQDEDSWLSNTLAPDERLVMPGSVGFGRKLFYRHDEIEYGVPFASWRACVAEILELLRQRAYFSIIEVRFTPNSSAGLIGPGVGRRTAYIELATPLSQPTEEVYAAVEQIFRRYGGQPHLGKKTNVTADEMLALHGERYVSFQSARRAQDPRGIFLNAFTARVLGG